MVQVKQSSGNPEIKQKQIEQHRGNVSYRIVPHKVFNTTDKLPSKKPLIYIDNFDAENGGLSVHLFLHGR